MTKISVPVEDDNNKIKENLAQKIESGIYNIGKIIVPQKFEKVVLKDDDIIKEIVEISGKKKVFLISEKQF